MSGKNNNANDLAALILEYKESRNLELRNLIIEKNMRLAEGIAARYAGRGVDYEDLLQVALLALIGALERFDPSRGFKFSTFAAPTMLGEIKNYFRDKTRMMHISRRDSEQLLAYNEAREALEKEGAVKTSDLAKRLGVDEERVLELMEMRRALSVSSLERVLGDSERDGTFQDMLGQDDAGFLDVETRSVLAKAFEILDEREKLILEKRFWKRMPQSKVAEELGVSQMYISRAERKILAKLRNYIED